MRLGTIFYLYRVRLRARLVQELLAVAGIAVGVALLFASQVANTSLSGSVSQLTNGLVGNARWQVTARSPLGFDQSLLSKVQVLPGVLTAAPVLQRSVNLVGPDGSASVDLIGVNAIFASLKGKLLQHLGSAQLPRQEGLALPDPIAQKLGVAASQSLELQLGNRATRTAVAVVLQSSDIGELVASPLVIAPLGLSQRLTAMPNSITRIVVEPRPGEENKVRKELTTLAGAHLNVTPATFDATIFMQAEGPTSQSTELFSAISALVGFMFAFNAMLLTVPQRRNLINDLRLDGYPSLEIVEVLLFDALMLGIVGSAAGLLLGEFLSRGLLQANPGYLSFAFPVGSARIVSWQSIAIACSGGLLAAFAGVTIPLRGDILAHESSVERKSKREPHVIVWGSLAAGLGALVVTSLILLNGITTIGAAIIAFMGLVIAMLFILPVVFKFTVKLFDVVQRPVVGVSPRIAVIELQSGSTRARSLAIAATGAIAVFGSVAIQGARQNLERGLNRVARETAGLADIWVSPRGESNTIATTPFIGIRTSLLGKLPGVRSVDIYRGGFLDVGDHRMLVIAPARSSSVPVAPSQVIGNNSDRADALIRRGGWAALSKVAADELHLRVGQSFSLPTPVPAVFRLAAITTNFGWPPGTIVLNSEDYSRAWATNQPNAYQVDVVPGYPVATVQREIRTTLGRSSQLTVQTARQREQAFRSAQSQGLSRLSEIAALVLIAAVLAMAAAMASMVWQRRSRLAGMKVDGFDQRELWRALLYESAVLLGTGCSIGAVFGLCGQAVLTHALAGITGFPVVFVVGGVIASLVFAGVTTVAVAIAALPGYVAARVKPALQD
jgi:putative ABC transport system permease protein